VTGIITIFVSLVVVPFLLRKYQGLKIVVISLMGAGLFSFLTFILPQEGVIYFIFSLFMVYTGFKTVYEPAMIAHLNEQKVINTGALMGLRQSALALGAVLGPAIAGVLYGVINFYLFIILASLLMLASLMLMGYQNKGGAKT
jgi:MFS family permease